MTWGKDMGCDFATLSCMEMMAKEKKGHFCSSIMDVTPMTFCTHDRYAEALGPGSV